MRTAGISGSGVDRKAAIVGDHGMTDPETQLHRALSAQLRARRAALDAGAEHIGWKVALHVAPVESVVGSEPLFGYLTSATRIEPGGIFHARRVRGLRAESEVAIELGRDVQSTHEPVTVRAAIAGLATALELVDVEPAADDFESVIADNVYHEAFAIGPSQPVVPGTLLKATIWVNGELRAAGSTSEDFVAKLITIARLLEASGEGLRASNWVIARSLTLVTAGLV